MEKTEMETILLVDDNQDVVKVVRLQLERFGYTVISCLSGEEALERFKSTPDAFDLVISDMGMPGMDGFDLINSIKKIRSDIPTLICSGSDESIMGEDRKRCIADGFILKPFTMKEISEMTRALIHNRFH